MPVAFSWSFGSAVSISSAFSSVQGDAELEHSPVELCGVQAY